MLNKLEELNVMVLLTVIMISVDCENLQMLKC
jgi:hypothetical protein